jgi:hypothetical protein
MRKLAYTRTKSTRHPANAGLEVDGSAMFKGDGTFDGLFGLSVLKGSVTIGSRPCPTSGCTSPIGGHGDPLLKLTVFGNESITGNASFGAQTRQMLDLWKTEYGIGVQNSAFYQRTAGDFFWYKGGTHSDTFGDPGGGTQLMRLGNTGDLIITRSIVTPVLQITGGTDVAEPFKMSRENTPMGAVVIIDEQNVGRLKLSEFAYDTRVAGIVSGANGINPGISLSQKGTTEGGQNVALSGRVYVLADASSSRIPPVWAALPVPAEITDSSMLD